MKVLLAGTSLLPAYGGPAYSVTQLAVALAAAGVEVDLWASDQSAASTPLLSPSARVRPLTGDPADVLARYGPIDLVHDNGIWLPEHHRLAVLARQRRIPRLVSTRGMLEPWAMRHKGLKKFVAWHLYQRQDLRRAQVLHTTAKQEATNLERLRLGVSIRVIPNGIDLPALEVGAANRKASGLRTALFLGRIYPVKGLTMLIDAWAQVRPQGWCLRIAGPNEAGHQAVVERAVAKAGLAAVVSFVGPVADDAKHAAFRGAELLVLPSCSESFGMVVAEALAHGVPVLTTTATPWYALKERGCGWCVAPTSAAIAGALREATSCTASALRAMGAKGRDYMAAEFAWEAVTKRFIAAYEEAIARRPAA